MTLIEKQHQNKRYCISVSVENNCYVVEVCPRLNDNYFGYPERKMLYAITEKKKAYAAFNRYVKKYTD